MNDDQSKSEKSFYRVTINAPIEKVWSELVKTDSVLPFFFGAVCKTTGDLAPGKQIAMRTKDDKYTSMVGEVLEFKPPYRYSHTLKFTNLDDPYTTIIYELREIEDGVEFTLITKDVPKGTKSAKSMVQGSPFIIKTLKSICESGRPTLSGRLMLLMMKMMTPFTPKICLTENWPFKETREE